MESAIKNRAVQTVTIFLGATMIRLFVRCLVLVIVTVLLACANTKPCTKQEAIRAEGEASSLRSWAEVYKSHKKFARCDDGPIAEGYSHSIARLLTDQWKTIEELNRLVSHDRGFEKFMLRHVDVLMSPTQAENIRKNTEAHCPSDAKQLCGKINARIMEAGP